MNRFIQYFILVFMCIAINGNKRYIYNSELSNLNPLYAQDHNLLKPLPREWPCPDSFLIEPCICSFDAGQNLDMDCSTVQNEQELIDAFSSAVYPFTDFRVLSIQQNKDTQLISLHGGVFGTISFQNVVIINTNISLVEENVFSASYNTLISLDISNNMLNSFPFETIVSYTALETLDFSSNQLTSISISSNSLTTVDYSDNIGLQVMPGMFNDIAKVENIYIERIGLTALPQNLFSALEKIERIDMSGNELTTLDDNSFNVSENTINNLDLGDNMISTIRDSALQGFALGATISIRDNNLKFIEESVWKNVFDDITDQGNVDFSGNPLLCGCDAYWMFKGLGGNQYSGIVSQATNCYEGSQFATLPKQGFDTHCA